MSIVSSVIQTLEPMMVTEGPNAAIQGRPAHVM